MKGYFENLKGKTWESRGEKRKKKLKAIDVKLKVSKPQLRDDGAVKTIQILP